MSAKDLDQTMPETETSDEAAEQNALTPPDLVPPLRKGELVSMITARTDIRPGAVRPVLDAALQALGEAIADQRDVVLPGLGKLRVKTSKEVPGARITMVRMRQPLKQGAAAEDGDEDVSKSAEES